MAPPPTPSLPAQPLTLFDPTEEAELPPRPRQRVRLTVSYDGSRFHGFAANAGVPTVAATLGEALRRVLGHPPVLTCAGRTDKGVHAHGQVVDFETAPDVDLFGLCRSLNALCGPDIAVRDPAVVAPEFSARFDALRRTYRYAIHVGSTPDPFSTRFAWHVGEPLDLGSLRLACDPLLGVHDFSSFCRRPKRRDDGPAVSLERHVVDARWEVVDPVSLHFWIEASSFCHQMVRSIVGTLVEVGRGRRRAGEVRGIIDARDRSAAGPVAPPHGLSLWAVRYP